MTKVIVHLVYWSTNFLWNISYLGDLLVGEIYFSNHAQKFKEEILFILVLGWTKRHQRKLLYHLLVHSQDFCINHEKIFLLFKMPKEFIYTIENFHWILHEHYLKLCSENKEERFQEPYKNSLDNFTFQIIDIFSKTDKELKKP